MTQHRHRRGLCRGRRRCGHRRLRCGHRRVTSSGFGRWKFNCRKPTARARHGPPLFPRHYVTLTATVCTYVHRE